MNTQEAISDIVTLGTLPPQIDYVRPYKVKAEKAEEFIDALPELEKDLAYQDIDNQIKSYYDSPMCYLDKLF